MTIRLFIDFDGVINAIEPQDAWPDYRQVAFPGAINSRIIWSPTMLSRLRELDMSIVWCTAWQELAAQYLSPLIEFGSGCAHLSPLNGVMDYPTIFWKREAVEAAVTQDPGPFVWLDDEMRVEDIAWARSVGGLAIATPVWHGLMPYQLEMIETYVKDPSSILL